MGEVRTIRDAVEQFPFSADSLFRTAVIDLDGATKPAQQALLKLLEEPPAIARFILVAEELHDVLPTIQSRCVVQVFSPPSYAETLKDYSVRMTLSGAAEAAKYIQQGISSSRLPDASSFQLADALMEQIGYKSLEGALAILDEFDDISLLALRLRLRDAGQLSALVVSYQTDEPRMAGFLVFWEIVSHKK